MARLWDRITAASLLLVLVCVQYTQSFVKIHNRHIAQYRSLDFLSNHESLRPQCSSKDDKEAGPAYLNELDIDQDIQSQLLQYNKKTIYEDELSPTDLMRPIDKEALSESLKKQSQRFLLSDKSSQDRSVNRFNNIKSKNGKRELCYLIGLDDKSLNRRKFSYNDDIVDDSKSVSKDASMYYSSDVIEQPSIYTTAYTYSGQFTMEESLRELSELAGAAGLVVAGATYQRVSEPNSRYYIGVGKTKEVHKAMRDLKCTCAIFDTELTPSQQKSLELALNEGSKGNTQRIKVIDRTALILDIFAQHARTKEGQLQVELALLTYRLPRLTNMWSHLERQSAGAKGKSNGGVGLRGPGEKQLESDRQDMKKKISLLKDAINNVRRHRTMQRTRRRRLGLPVVALVGYTNVGKSTVLNAFTNAGVYAADQLFATLDPTTRVVNIAGIRYSDILLTDTVGFISKLPLNLVAAFRATLEEIADADVLLHVLDVSNPAWTKQEAAVLHELREMGLAHKPLVTIWNKIDMVPDIKDQYKHLASGLKYTVAMSAVTGEGRENLAPALEDAISSQLEEISIVLSYLHAPQLDSIHTLGFLDSVIYKEDGIHINGKLPLFLKRRLELLISSDSNESVDESDLDDISDTIKLSEKMLGMSWEYLDNVEASVAADCDDKDCEDEWDPSKLIETDDYY